MASYTERWKTLGRLEWCFFGWIFVGSMLPFTVMLAVPQLIKFRSAAVREIVGYFFFGTWAGGALLLRLWLGTFKCQRCGFSFYGGARVPRKTCAHCGLDRKVAK